MDTEYLIRLGIEGGGSLSPHAIYDKDVGVPLSPFLLMKFQFFVETQHSQVDLHAVPKRIWKNPAAQRGIGWAY